MCECKFVTGALVSREIVSRQENDKEPGGHQGQESADPSNKRGVEQRRVISIVKPGEHRAIKNGVE